MNFSERINHFAGQIFIESPAKRKSYAQLRTSLEQSGQQIAGLLGRTPESAAAHALLRHILTIERWGQSRLRVALGQAFVLDQSKDHAPPKGLSWAELRQSFQSTRAQTLELSGQLEQRNPNGQVLHNQWGPISAKGWLSYLNTHASLESKKFKAA